MTNLMDEGQLLLFFIRIYQMHKTRFSVSNTHDAMVNEVVVC